jgi:2,3,4,5-tetrahydropyridine-2-carboxylate N-succinyltransferase
MTTEINSETNTEFFSYALGIGTQNQKGEWLEVYYPCPVFKPARAEVDKLADLLSYTGGNTCVVLDAATLAQLKPLLSSEQQAIATQLEGAARPVVITLLETDSALTSTPEAYLKLHLLSYRHVQPNQMDLSGIFPQLPNVAWTNQGAIDLDEITQAQTRARVRGETLEVASIDKFPKMTNYVVPKGVRIAHTARVRLGAYLGEGTTVMHEGFVNFNAGTEGPNMVEGRLSQGVMMYAGSDLGGGASTMGTLSGGGDMILSVGRDCLIGANAGSGIPLGDRCKVEAGLYITASTVVLVLDEDKQPVRTVKARELAGQSDMLFIRNSQTGVVECRTNAKAIALNAALHAHN